MSDCKENATNPKEHEGRIAKVLSALSIIVGLVLLWFVMHYAPVMEQHTGQVVLADQAAFDQFARDVVNWEIPTYSYQVYGSGVPCVVALNVVTDINSGFPYGDISGLSWWDALLEHDGVLWPVVFLLSIMLLLLPVVSLLGFAIWPKWVDHTPAIRVEWIPNKRPERTKGIETIDQGRIE